MFRWFWEWLRNEPTHIHQSVEHEGDGNVIQQTAICDVDGIIEEVDDDVPMTKDIRMSNAIEDLRAAKALHGRLSATTIPSTADAWDVPVDELRKAWKKASR